MNEIRRNRYNSWAKALCLCFGFLVMGAIECGTRLAFPKTHLEQILDILTMDPALFWRNRDSLHTHFAGPEVHTDRLGFRIGEKFRNKLDSFSPSATRIVCMGASPTFGWGVGYEESYPAVLERLLREEADLEVEVINGGMIGYSSHQGKGLLKSVVAPMKPDWITVSYVINDIDKYRFYLNNGKPDRHTSPPASWVILMRNLLGKSRFFQVFQRSFQTIVHGRSTFEGRPVEVFRPQSMRVPLEDYRANINEIITFSRDEGIRVLLVKMKVNLPPAPQTPLEKKKAAEGHLQRGIQYAEQEEYQDALASLEAAVELDPTLSEAHYFMGLCHRRTGNEEEASKAIDRTMKSEAYRCGGDGLKYNAALEEIAREQALPMVDVPAAFGQREGASFFLTDKGDPIHPNKTGHEVIGREMFHTLEPAIASMQGR
ncbi:tetratricopeptide repeat protein [Thermodesulfobacteriota bacterium]